MSSVRLDVCNSTAASPLPITPLAVSPQVAGDLLGIRITRVYVLMRAGQLHSYTCGRARRIAMASIQAYVERRLAESAASGWRAWAHNPQARRKRQEPTAPPQKRRARIDQHELNAE